MNIRLYNVAPSVPSELRFLEELSYNMWWCYHPEAQELFERIDPVLWQEVEGNTRLFMSRLPQGKLEELARDPLYVRELKNIETEFRRDVQSHDDIRKRKVAYFSMEFGIHESVRIFSGGLGVLAGDHLKAASDLHPYRQCPTFFRSAHKMPEKSWKIRFAHCILRTLHSCHNASAFD